MDKLKLFCFPHAGGSALYYSRWKRFFEKDIDFIVVDYPGREKRIAEPFVDSIQSLAADFVNQTELEEDDQYALFGHSMGASVAYESALLMKERYGRLPVCMFVSGADAPGTLTDRFRQKLDGASVGDIGNSELCELVRLMGGIDDRLLDSKDFMDYFLPIIRKDMILCDMYRVTKVEQLETQINCLFGQEDNFVNDSDIRRWQSFSTLPITIDSYSGGHFYLDDHIEELAEFMKHKMID